MSNPHIFKNYVELVIKVALPVCTFALLGTADLIAEVVISFRKLVRSFFISLFAFGTENLLDDALKGTFNNKTLTKV